MIELTNICKRYGDKQILDNICMTFNEGITCIMGPSGRGKTTLAYIIGGLIKSDSGYITGLEGKRTSFVFQEDRLLDWETAIGNVLFVTKSIRQNQEKADHLLMQAGLSESMYKKAAELSGGMKRRVCLCRALIADYELLILDEPFKGLDSGIKPLIMTMVKEHSLRSEGKTVICITHDLTEAEFLGGKLVTM
ncbi:MAG: ATP-binding cassette domain-containing protein [Defluviitaleaceae bacterium]|nr:ATP-binding cassette domain-containing protein [Defluviitaleaceae bacterium]